MKAYLRNLGLWLTGWGKLGTLAYQPGWTAWGWKPFWVLYATTYLGGVLLGFGVVSLSRAWYERREISRFAHLMTRLLNWLVPGKHGMHTGGWLWGSKSVRRMG